MTTVARQLTVALACLQIAGCGGGKTTPETRQAQTDSARGEVDADTPVSIRFAIELSGATDGPIYVSLNGADNQLGWVTVFRDGERIYFGERCEIEDCGVPPAVCGAALSMVRDVAAADERGIAFVWDGMTSTIDPSRQCERRQPAPPGNYVARFCYSREATVQGGDPARAAQGSVRNPTCVDRTFTLHEHEIVFRIG